MTAHALNDFDLISDSLEAIAGEGDYAMLAAFFTSWTASPVLGPRIREALSTILARHRRRPFALICQGPAECLRLFEEDGHLVFEDPALAIRALAHLSAFAEAHSRPAGDETLPDIGWMATLPGRTLGEREAKSILAAAGIGVIFEEHAATAIEAGAAASRIARPVALKIDSPDITHKSDVGGVRLALSGACAVEEAAHAMAREVADKAPEARLEGFLVSPMAGDGVELLVGVHNDAAIGPLVVVGMGGVFVEVLKDVVLEPVPVSVERARAMIDRLKGAALMTGTRGRPALDVTAAAEAVSRLSVLADRERGNFESIEINPLLVRTQGAVALDALVTARHDQAD